MELVKEEPPVPLANRVVRPTRGHVLVLPIPKEEMTEGGIYLPPDRLGEGHTPDHIKRYHGRVVAIGAPAYLPNGSERTPVANVGDEVFYSRVLPHIPAEVVIDGQRREYHLLDQEEIMAVVE